MAEQAEAIITGWLAWREQLEQEIRRALGYPDEVALEPSRYIWRENLGHLYHVVTFPGHLYFSGERLALLYIESPERFYPQLTPAALQATLGEPAARLASRAGHEHVQYVYPEQGVAYSASLYEVSFIEIFTPITLEEYRSQFYLKPPVFTH